MSSSEIPVMEAEGTDTVDPYVSELPDSFEDSIARMGKGTLQSMDEVRWVCVWRCRCDGSHLTVDATVRAQRVGTLCAASNHSNNLIVGRVVLFLVR